MEKVFFSNKTHSRRKKKERMKNPKMESMNSRVSKHGKPGRSSAADESLLVWTMMAAALVLTI